MSQKTDAELTSEANIIGAETTAGANSADRVRDMLVNLIDSKLNNDDYSPGDGSEGTQADVTIDEDTTELDMAVADSQFLTMVSPEDIVITSIANPAIKTVYYIIPGNFSLTFSLADARVQGSYNAGEENEIGVTCLDATGTPKFLITYVNSLGSTPSDASETVKGIVELATTAEVVTGTDTVRAATPAGVKAAWDAEVVARNAAIASAVVGLMDYRGVFDASGNAYPTSANSGSGTAGAILKSDFWIISVAGTLPTGLIVAPGDLVIAKQDTPGNTQANWSIVEYNIGYTPVNKAGDTMGGNLAMGGNKVTGLAAATANGDAVRYEDIVGVQDLYIPASAMWPRTTNGCAALAKSEIATSLLNIQGLAFDDTTQEFAQFTIALPRKYNNGTITAVVYWTTFTGSGDVQWGISGGAYSNDDALTVALGTAQTTDDTRLADNDLHISPATSAITLAGTPADADFLGFQISRNPASDTKTGDAILLGISLRITVDAGKDA